MRLKSFSMPREKTSNELRCFCARKPLLATYGVTPNGKPYVHVKIYKQARIFGEVIVRTGEVLLHCRECLRWHKVIIRPRGEVRLEEETDPPMIAAGA
jgi:hypothetical protein